MLALRLTKVVKTGMGCVTNELKNEHVGYVY